MDFLVGMILLSVAIYVLVKIGREGQARGRAQGAALASEEADRHGHAYRPMLRWINKRRGIFEQVNVCSCGKVEDDGGTTRSTGPNDS